MEMSPAPGDANRYEAPKVKLGSRQPSRRGLPSDQVLAARLLVARDRGGYPLGLWLRWNARPYLILAVLLVAYLALMAYGGTWLFFALALGFGLGTVLRDVGWLRGVRKTWSFSERVTDWEEVQRIAAGEAPAEVDGRRG
jgi:hypothetical protein